MVGTTELIVIAVVILVLFGGAQLPKLAKSLGEFIYDFNKAKDNAPKKSKKSKKNK